MGALRDTSPGACTGLGLRELQVTPENESWAARATGTLNEGTGVNSIGSCSGAKQPVAPPAPTAEQLPMLLTPVPSFSVPVARAAPVIHGARCHRWLYGQSILMKPIFPLSPG
jgi:hypothetical protein